MQHLNTLINLAGAASQVADIVRSTETFRFTVEPEVTFYLHTSAAEVRITRWDEPRLEVAAALQAPFGWRVETDQDEAGVYFVARRRPVVGGLAGATFHASVPRRAYLVLKLTDCPLTIDGLTGTIHLPPPDPNTDLTIQPAKL